MFYLGKNTAFYFFILALVHVSYVMPLFDNNLINQITGFTPINFNTDFCKFAHTYCRLFNQKTENASYQEDMTHHRTRQITTERSYLTGLGANNSNQYLFLSIVHWSTVHIPLWPSRRIHCFPFKLTDG